MKSRWLTSATALALVAGCTLAVPLDGLTGGNAQPGQDAGDETTGGCSQGWADCDGLPSTGCEMNIDGHPANCGKCGHSCGVGATCTSGKCDPIAVWTGGTSEIVSALALDATRVYWTNTSGGTVLSRLKDGTGQVEIASSQPSPKSIALDEANVYWTTSGGTVMRSPKSGGAPTAIASSQTGLTNPLGLGVDQASVYWLTEQIVRKAAKSGGAAEDLASGESGLTAMALDAARVYWVSFNGGDGTLKSIPKGGGTAVTLVSGLNQPMAIATTASHVYIAERGTDAQGFNDGVISRVSTGGGAKEALKQGQGAPYSIAVQGASLYWTNFNNQTVVSIPVPAIGDPAETPVLLATMQSGAKGVAADGTWAFWLSNNAVLKVALP